MKKLLVVLLVVALTLSLAVVASAASLSAYVGGRVQWSYISSDALKDTPTNVGNSGLKMLLQGKVSDEATGTWANIGAKLSGWPDENKDMSYVNIYDLGIKKVGGSDLNIWWSSWENENMKRGQAAVYNVGPNQYHDDPMFNHALGGVYGDDKKSYGVLGLDYITDNVVVNFGYLPNKGTLKANEMAVAGTFKFDGGDVHLANFAGADKLSESNVGGTFKLGFGTISADYVTKTPDGGKASSIIQANVAFTDLKFDVTVISDDKYKFTTDGGSGYQVRYTGFDKVTLAYKAMTATAKADETANFTDMYIGYKFGIFDTRIGTGTNGTGSNNGFTYVSCYASLW